jgi:predicted transporter
MSNGLFAELKRRNVIRVAGLYLVGAWLIVQVAETLLPTFDAPTWVLRATMILLAIGFVVGMNALPQRAAESRREIRG